MGKGHFLLLGWDGILRKRALIGLSMYFVTNFLYVYHLVWHDKMLQMFEKGFKSTGG